MINTGKRPMMFHFPGPDATEEQVGRVLAALAEGKAPRDTVLPNVDVKEEPSRRDRGGSVLPGTPENERAAEYLAGELACLANTPGGGALVVGITEDGTHIGTRLDAQRLRHRMSQLSSWRQEAGTLVCRA